MLKRFCCLVDHPFIRILKTYKDSVSKSSLPIHFYKSVENVLGLHRFECGKLIIFLQIFCRVDKKIKYEVTRNLTNKLGQATRSNVTYWRSILVPTWVEFIHFLLRHNDSLAVTFNITQQCVNYLSSFCIIDI